MARDQSQTLTEPMCFTLLVLGQVRSGAEITSWVGEITGGRIKLLPGTLYALLAQFLENDLIKRVETERKGKYYILTDEGRNLLIEEVQKLRLSPANYDNYFGRWMRGHGYGGNHRISRYKKEEGGAYKARKDLGRPAFGKG